MFRYCVPSMVAASILIVATGAQGATPVISSVSGGQVLSIQGSNFGVKSPAAPLLWETFENGSNGTVVSGAAIKGNWDSGEGSHEVTYTTLHAYGGQKSALHSFTVGRWNASLAKNGQFPVLYMDFQRYYPASNGYPSNYKPWRLYGDNDTMQLNKVYGCNYQAIPISHGSYSHVYWGAQNLQNSMDQWLHYQLIFHESSPGNNNGIIIHYRNCQVDGANNTNAKTRLTSAHFNQIRIGHYFDVHNRDSCNPSDNSKLYTDNVYLDTTLARVEIGDRPDYNSCTHREIQIPTSWSNNTITVTTNPGTFHNGDTAYVFVVNANNQVSQGHEIRISNTITGPATQLMLAPEDFRRDP